MTNFNNKPFVEVKQPFEVWKGWNGICEEINNSISKIEKNQKVIVIETYQGVIDEELVKALQEGLKHDLWISAKTAMKKEDAVKTMVYSDVTDDRIFGALSKLNISDFYDPDKIGEARDIVQECEGVTIIYGVGSSLIP
jgi:hypothetical protein